jgi:hypothetical protein
VKIICFSSVSLADEMVDSGALSRFHRPDRRCWTARPDLGERWSSRLVATAAEERLSNTALDLNPWTNDYHAGAMLVRCRSRETLVNECYRFFYRGDDKSVCLVSKIDI